MLQAPALLCCMPVPITHTDASLLPALQIWLYRDKATGQLKGDATVTFEDPFAAASAPSWFNGKTWSDGRSVLHVSLADKPQEPAYGGGYGGGGGGGYGGGGGGYGALPGSATCWGSAGVPGLSCGHSHCAHLCRSLLCG